jgi:RYamide receptor
MRLKDLSSYNSDLSATETNYFLFDSIQSFLTTLDDSQQSTIATTATKSSLTDKSMSSNIFFSEYEANSIITDRSTIDSVSYETINSVSIYLKVLASVFYLISFVLGLGGNTLVFLVVIYFQRMKTVNNFFMLNLAVSYLIFALFCIPSTYITAYLIQYWPLTELMCIFFNYMQNVSVTLTVYTLIWITLDKFWALVKPLKLRMSVKMCKFLIGLSWLFSLFISLPIAMYTKLDYSIEMESEQRLNSSYSHNHSLTSGPSVSTASIPTSTIRSNYKTFHENFNKQKQLPYPQCVEDWPKQGSFDYSRAYNIFLLLVQYFIPLIIMTFCYTKIGIVLKKTKAPGESIELRDVKMINTKKKVRLCFFAFFSFYLSQKKKSKLECLVIFHIIICTFFFS